MEEIYSRPLLFGVVIDPKFKDNELNGFIFSSPVIRGSYRSNKDYKYNEVNGLILVPCYSG